MTPGAQIQAVLAEDNTCSDDVCNSRICCLPGMKIGRVQPADYPKKQPYRSS
jgi:hypothetical protein